MLRLLLRALGAYAFALFFLLLVAPRVLAQDPVWSSPESNVVVPQMHSVLLRPDAGRLHVESVRADVAIARQVATTSLEIALSNPGTRVEEATLCVPVPDGATVRGFDFEGAALEPTARLLAADEARSTYRSIVSRSKDPALLEFAGHAMLRSSVFPVPPCGTQRVRVVYEHLLLADGDRVDYVLPRSESLSSEWIPWTVSLRLVADQPIATLYSPTHAIEETRVSPEEVLVEISPEAARQPGSLRLSWLLEGAGVSASIFAHPDPRTGGGTFLMLAGLPVERPAEASVRRREVIVALDRSGSMAGEKLEQARAACLQVLSGLEDGELFNLIDYSSSVERFAPAPVPKDAETLERARAYLGALEAGGGTAIDYALALALAQDHDPETVPILLFLTDGRPTTGVTDEAEIRENAERANRHGRRIFTIGVGDDVNAPLLDHLAEASRATPAYVAPSEDVEEVVSGVFRRLHGPVLSAPRLTVRDRSGAEVTDLVRDLAPAVLFDLYEGDQLVVLGRYTREEACFLQLSGDWFGEERAFAFHFDPARASASNAFVPRLWASRRIGELIDEVRQGGAAGQKASSLAADPRTAELMQEILRLSTEHGVLTEYTSFLALEGTPLTKPEAVLAQLDQNLRTRARAVRVGRGATAQSRNLLALKRRVRVDRANGRLDDSLQTVRETRVVHVGDRTFFRRANTWVDARVARHQGTLPTREVAFGTPEHVAVARRLVDGGRASTFALRGSVLVELGGEAILIRPPGA